MQTLYIMYIVFAVILIGLALPMMFDKVPPNRWYGFRVPKTLNNPEVWYAVNRVTGRWLFVGGLAFLAATIGFHEIPGISLDMYALACLAAFFPFSLIGVVAGVAEMRRFE